MSIINFYTERVSPLWRVTSPYGYRTHPFTGKRTHHNGVDLIPLVSDRRIPIPAPASGKITYARFVRSRGNTVVQKIEGTNEMFRYQHLDRFTLKPGDYAHKKDSIGICGTSGDSTGVHLHIEVVVNDGTSFGGRIYCDPAEYIAKKAEPSETFEPGDLITTTAKPHLNIRSAPGVSGDIVGQLKDGDEVRVVRDGDNGIFASGYHWWKIEQGWVAERWLTEVPEEPEEVKPEPEPEIKPEPDLEPTEPEIPSGLKEFLRMVYEWLKDFFNDY